MPVKRYLELAAERVIIAAAELQSILQQWVEECNGNGRREDAEARFDGYCLLYQAAIDAHLDRN
jgi:hypothetical protein